MAMIRLDRFLTEMGCGTRSQVKAFIRKGRVRVDEAVIKQPECKVDPVQTMVSLDGKQITYSAFEYYMLNKPAGVVSATEDKKYETVVSLITERLRQDLFPVGRLDLDTEGLLLITNDGALAHQLLSPKHHVDKVYYAELSAEIPADAVQRFAEGIALEEDFVTLPAKLTVLSPKTAEVTIQEGKFHQIKRMFEAVGVEVVYLKRLSMGTLLLDDSLAPGEYRPLSTVEVNRLKQEK